MTVGRYAVNTDCFKFSLFYKFKMLIVFTCGPVAAPFESGLGEEAKAEVVMINLVGEIPVAVTIDFGCGGLNEECAIIALFIVRVVERVDVDGQSTGMFRQVGAA